MHARSLRRGVCVDSCTVIFIYVHFVLLHVRRTRVPSTSRFTRHVPTVKARRLFHVQIPLNFRTVPCMAWKSKGRPAKCRNWQKPNFITTVIKFIITTVLHLLKHSAHRRLLFISLVPVRLLLQSLNERKYGVALRHCVGACRSVKTKIRQHCIIVIRQQRIGQTSQ